ncbi:MAG: ATP-binding cassette domain-containing protein, partial [Actinomycetota bacterium]|nr:ATP-binding cassette domain-containing protein [Actinomycetota bacterium]
MPKVKSSARDAIRSLCPTAANGPGDGWAKVVAMSVGLTVRELCHSYPTSNGPLLVLDGVSLDVPAGGYAVVTGASGAGKTTLLAILGGLERPGRGRVEVGGQDITRLSGNELAAYRRSTVGFVFQHFGLLDALTAAENVELATTLAGTPRGRRRARAAELLAAVGLAGR